MSGPADPDLAFEDNPQGWAKRWAVEFKAAKSALEKWWAQGESIVKVFKQDRDTGDGKKELALFTANTQTMQAMSYGQTPSVDVKRRFSDSHDDVARIGAEVMERCLNSDIEEGCDGYAVAIENALEDWFLPGWGVAMAKYHVEWEEVPGKPAMTMVHPETGETMELAPEVPPQKQKKSEACKTYYVPWRDQLKSPCRFHDEMRWWATKTAMTREELVSFFGEDVGRNIPLNKKAGNKDADDARRNDPWSRAEVWEVWDKEHRCRWYYVEGHHQVLCPAAEQANPNGSVPDTLGLRNFWPFPRPLCANATTSDYIPRPNYVIHQDKYEYINALETRIAILTEAIRVVGCHDAAFPEMANIMNAADNTSVPVNNFALLVEKGGIQGVMATLPIGDIAAALDKLREMKREAIAELDQLEGMSDIMRGEASAPATATEQRIKGRFASVRITRVQNEFARFASDLQGIKAEIMAKFFDEKTLADRSNVLNTDDAPKAGEAIQFLKSNFWQYRIAVTPESVSMTDYAADRQEGVEALQGLSQTFTAMMPLMQGGGPPAMKFVVGLGQWLMARLRGGSSLEPLFDQFVTEWEMAQQQAAMQPPPPPPPDPKVEAAKVKAQGDVMKTQAATQGRLLEIDKETMAEIAKQNAQALFNVRETAATEAIKAKYQPNDIGDPGAP